MVFDQVLGAGCVAILAVGLLSLLAFGSGTILKDVGVVIFLLVMFRRAPYPFVLAIAIPALAGWVLRHALGSGRFLVIGLAVGLLVILPVSIAAYRRTQRGLPEWRSLMMLMFVPRPPPPTDAWTAPFE